MRYQLVIGVFCLAALQASACNAAKVTVLHSFNANTNDGYFPAARLVKAAPLLYGTTPDGGSSGAGTIYSVDPKTGSETVVYSFQPNGIDGLSPESGLINVRGVLYGTTPVGGSGGNCGGGQGCGTVFSFDPKLGVEEVLYSFLNDREDGNYPLASLVNVNGMLYGTTYYGGNANCNDTRELGCGTVFSFDPRDGFENPIHVFEGGIHGQYPAAPLLAIGTTLYGTTTRGGYNKCNSRNNGCGTIFAVDTAPGTEKVLYNFAGSTDGGVPLSGLTDVNGTLYGTTSEGGNTSCGDMDGCGTVFTFGLTTNNETVVHRFCGQEQCADGSSPKADMVLVNDKLYGTALAGGTGSTCSVGLAGCGTVFSFDTQSGVEKTVYSFQGAPDDAGNPAAGLIELKHRLYGTTEGGGSGTNCGDGCGTVFELKP